MTILRAVVAGGVIAALVSAAVQYVMVVRSERRGDVAERREIYAQWITRAKEHLVAVEEPGTAVLEGRPVDPASALQRIRATHHAMGFAWERLLLVGTQEVVDKAVVARSAIRIARDQATGDLGDGTATELEQSDGEWRHAAAVENAYGALEALLNAARVDVRLKSLSPSTFSAPAGQISGTQSE